MTKHGLIYLASPYTHDDPHEVEKRVDAVIHAGAWLMNQQFKVFSPIAHCHHMAIAHGLPTHFEYWEAYDRLMIELSHILLILKIDGWEDSKGVRAEIKIANDLARPIYEMLPYIVDDGSISYELKYDSQRWQ